MSVKFGSRNFHSAPSLLRSVILFFQFAILLSTPLLSTQAIAGTATFAVGPDHNQELLLSVLRSAKKSLWINVYQFDQPEIRKTLLKQIQAGVSVRLLIEGEPLGKVSAEGYKTMNALCDAMASHPKDGHRLFVMTSTAGAEQRRYRYDHAKYVIADQQTVLITSENFTSGGHANPGHVGNRGWDVSLEDPTIAADLSQIFKTDTSLKSGDVVELVHAGCQLPDGQRSKDNESSKIRTVDPIPMESGQVRGARLISSPNSLPALVELIKSAKSYLNMEEMSLSSNWREDGKAKTNPLVEALIDRARSGVRTQVLLNDEAVFHAANSSPNSSEDSGLDDAHGNRKTALFLNQVARCEHLPIEAKIVDIAQVQISYIHNKGILVDGERALVSSINGTQNAIMNNRETGLILDSTDAARYYGQAFDFDWTSSASLENQPCQLRVFESLQR